MCRYIENGCVCYVICVKHRMASLSGSGFLPRTTADHAGGMNASQQFGGSRTQFSKFEEQAIDKNPFVLPTDEEAFRLRETEKRENEQRRATQRNMPIWERLETTGTLSKTRRMVEQIVPDVDPAALKKARESRGLLGAATAATARDRRRERETVQAFVQKKREMFLVQMSLDIKTEEIAKLEAKAKAHEEALKKSELLLEEDAIRFDHFVKDTDQQAHEALRRAEAAAKAKAEKLHQLKKLKHNIGVVTAEKAKVKEALEEYRRYKSFLDGLTPQDWVNERLAEQLEERKRRQGEQLEAKVEAWKALRTEKEAAVTARVEADRKRALRLGQQPMKVDVQALVQESMPPLPVLADIPLPELTEEEKELPMYFTRPGQLSDIFSQLEESNLFLIQLCQDTEQQLEELRALNTETSSTMQAQTADLNREMQVLQAQLAAEEMKVAMLRARAVEVAEAGGGDEGEGQGGPSSSAAAGAGGGVQGGPSVMSATSAGGKSGRSATSGGAPAPADQARALDSLLPALRAQVMAVYERSGFKSNASSDTVGMLTQLEGRLESLLTALGQLDPAYVAMKEREKERQRRTRVREARMATAARAHELRQQRMLERAQAPVIKRVGKPIMYRSILPSKPKDTVVVDEEEEKRKQEAKYFS